MQNPDHNTPLVKQSRPYGLYQVVHDANFHKFTNLICGRRARNTSSLVVAAPLGATALSSHATFWPSSYYQLSIYQELLQTGYYGVLAPARSSHLTSGSVLSSHVLDIPRSIVDCCTHCSLHCPQCGRPTIDDSGRPSEYCWSVRLVAASSVWFDVLASMTKSTNLWTTFQPLGCHGL